MTDTTIEDEIASDETDEELRARLDVEVELDELSAKFVAQLVEKLLVLVDEMSGHPLYSYQRAFAYRMLESLIINDGATLTALFSRQSGKALATDTPIPTPSGWVDMGDLCAGGLVYGPDGEPVLVTHVHPVEYGRPCYVVTFDDGTSITADARHEWVLADGRTVETQDLYGEETGPQPRVRVAQPISGTDEILPVPPYTLGVWLGDGSSAGSDITNADGEVMENVANDGFLVEERIGTPYTWSIGGLYGMLRRAGLMKGKGTGRKHIPDVYLRASAEQRKTLLTGIMDSDGYVSTRGEAEIVTISPILRDDIVELIRSLGYKVTCHESRATLYGADKGPRFRIKFTPYAEDGVCSLTRRSERMRRRPDHAPRSAFHRIVSIGETWSVPVRCITVEGGVFLAGEGWTATHNSETVANTVAAAMVMLPKLARVYPELLGKYKEGLWVGAFGPVSEQAENLYGRIVDRLTSERAMEILGDPEIGDETYSRSRTTYLRNAKSLVRMQTCHPRARIEGRTYHLILVDECQDADEKVINKSIGPMGAATNATMSFTGTPSYVKGAFWRQIQLNRRQETKRGTRRNHFQADYREAGKYNPNYAKFVKRELLRLGTDSDEFRLSYKLEWLLDKGQFVTSDRLDELGDKSMQVLSTWTDTPVVVGIDPARKEDSTVVTVVWVDWDRVDEDGLMDHRVLSWLDLSGLDWETQFYRILEHCSGYSIYAVGVDGGGLGDVVVDRLRVLMPGVRVEALGSTRPDQSLRWKHLLTLIDKGKLGYPAHAKTRRLKVWRRFYTQMVDLEKKFVGPYVLAEAPEETDAHDDYADSLAMACILTREHMMPEVEQSVTPFYQPVQRTIQAA